MVVFTMNARRDGPINGDVFSPWDNRGKTPQDLRRRVRSRAIPPLMPEMAIRAASGVLDIAPKPEIVVIGCLAGTRSACSDDI